MVLLKISGELFYENENREREKGEKIK